MQTPDIQNILAELTRSIGETPKDILPIAESGSARKYFRIITDNKSLIGTFSNNVEENEAFLTFSKHFHDLGLNVPEVFAVNEERTCYLQSDFGDDNLFAHVQKALIASSGPSTGSGTLASYSENVIQLYKKALGHLVKLQVLGHQGLDYTKAYPTECFDRQAIIDDFNYFKYYFVKPHEEIDFNETRLGKDFEAFADFVSQAPCDFFMYRDFQSRNIMVKDGELYFIDFQGGRKGPLNYDVVSLLYQVKAQIPQATRDELVEYYKAELSQYMSPETVKFDTYQPYFVYLRLMQVLGAYGFRGLIQKKSHFIESIPYALKELKVWNEKHPLNAYPELQHVLSQLSTLNYPTTLNSQLSTLNYPTTLNSKLSTLNSKLTVTINSFSFRKGYPNDFSGNGGGFVFDCRALPNPGREPEFKTKTGRDWEVIDYLMAKPPVHVFLDHVKGIVEQSVDNYRERHFSNLMVSFGCTGGQHRSVFFAQTIYEWLKATYPDIHLKLNHIERKITEETGL
jgi:aminoglycoside/choline kinase family phosphotransferase